MLPVVEQESQSSGGRLLYLSDPHKTETQTSGKRALFFRENGQCGSPFTGKELSETGFEEAEKALLFAEFHDALPGSGTQLVEEDTLRLLDHGLEILSREKLKAAIALTAGERKSWTEAPAPLSIILIPIRSRDSLPLRWVCQNRTGKMYFTIRRPTAMGKKYRPRVRWSPAISA